MDLMEVVFTILDKEGSPLHYKEIATRVMNFDRSLGDDINKVSSLIASKLLANTKRKDKASIIFKRIPNGKGGFKAGMYGVKRRPAPKPAIPELIDTPVATTFTGKAGEYGVFSELLYWGYNPAMMVVDHGIDIIASKDSEFFNIQVKTANPNANKNFSFKITKHIFKNHENSKTFYVFVIRRDVKGRPLSDYAIIPSSEIRRLMDLGIISSGKDISFSISIDNNEFKINNKHQVARVNDFSIIR